jgi:hypothetical protein
MNGRGETIVRVSAVVAVVLLALAVRVIGGARAELAEARALDGHGDPAVAISHYRRAARWYAPLSPYPEEALARLAEIGTHAEDAGDTDLALSAWRSIRAATLGSRSFYVPYEDRLHEADRHIAALMARLPPPPIEVRRSVEEREAAHLALLEAEVGPSPFASFAALVGLGTWIAAAFLFATRAFGDDDKIVSREARRWGGVFLGGMVLFLVGLWLA